jgi:hypothetical protein
MLPEAEVSCRAALGRLKDPKHDLNNNYFFHPVDLTMFPDYTSVGPQVKSAARRIIPARFVGPPLV